jgi:hypothetical protein
VSHNERRGRAVGRHAVVGLFAALLAAGCAQKGGASDSAPSPAPAAPAAAAAPAPTANPNAGKIGPGMNAQGQVVDPKKVEAGWGQKVKGLNDWEGEITGKPVPGSKFSKLSIGMSMKEATDVAGQPTDQGAYVSGKAFIPFYFGSGGTRYEMAYKGTGRLIFAQGSRFSSSYYLVWIIHSANETGYR